MGPKTYFVFSSLFLSPGLLFSQKGFPQGFEIFHRGLTLFPRHIFCGIQGQLRKKISFEVRGYFFFFFFLDTGGPQLAPATNIISECTICFILIFFNTAYFQDKYRLLLTLNVFKVCSYCFFHQNNLTPAGTKAQYLL